MSEWENVEGLGVPSAEHNIPNEGIDVTLEMPDLYRKLKKIVLICKDTYNIDLIR